ncbi:MULTISPECIES: ABC transporter ATP-binding protein [Streptomyces]|uniref:Macrolide export ATP-binding/permease protein n=1 Tax=Streptomyces scabiei TaxID=1930 RepID=A0A124C554_STRSC|nr:MULTISPECIES: ABC transporter ATP-binding protein [Streptomyces]MDX3069110.1 ABC transporter ATP-binding protein [Streptomyces sp. ND04-05B]GAQ66531.1 macrolide export ATP-binding/permease protein [Streptomyces scabiei]
MTSASYPHHLVQQPHTPPPAASAVDLTKVYGTGARRVVALDRVSVSFARGQFTAIMGPSGSGKSTLMQCLAGLDSPTSGSARIGAMELSRLSDRRSTLLRRDRIGFIFQAFHLLPTLTVAENITLPLGIAGRRPDPQWLEQVVTALGLSDRLTHRPGELSGGQQQRVACARALAGRPEIVFADEPTGNLDTRAGAEVLSLLSWLVHHLGQTIVMVTHDPAAAAYADRVVFLADGHVVDDLWRPDTGRLLERMKRFDGPSGHQR